MILFNEIFKKIKNKNTKTYKKFSLDSNSSCFCRFVAIPFPIIQITPFSIYVKFSSLPRNVQASAGALNILLQFLLKAHTWFTLQSLNASAALMPLCHSLSIPTLDPVEGRVILVSFVCRWNSCIPCSFIHDSTFQ